MSFFLLLIINSNIFSIYIIYIYNSIMQILVIYTRLESVFKIARLRFD